MQVHLLAQPNHMHTKSIFFSRKKESKQYVNVETRLIYPRDSLFCAFTFPKFYCIILKKLHLDTLFSSNIKKRPTIPFIHTMVFYISASGAKTFKRDGIFPFLKNLTSRTTILLHESCHYSTILTWYMAKMSENFSFSFFIC